MRGKAVETRGWSQAQVKRAITISLVGGQQSNIGQTIGGGCTYVTSETKPRVPP